MPGTIELYAEGALVIAVKSGSGLKVARLEDLRKSKITRIAIANPEHAPYGMSAMEALKSAGLWEELKSKLVYGENIRQALQFVESGNAGGRHHRPLHCSSPRDRIRWSAGEPS